jgi:hypothetical protein
MQYEKTAHIIQPELSHHYIASSQISLLTEQADYTFLSELLLLSQDALYQMTLHRFSPPFQHLDVFPVIKNPYKSTLYLQPATTSYQTPTQQPRLERGLLRSFFLPNLTTQICPLCLLEGIAYDRLYWKARYLLTCPTHAILLLRRCSTCHKPIPSSRLDPTICPFCHHPYHLDPSALVPILPETTCLLHGDLLTLHALGVTDLAPLPHDPRAAYSPAHYFALMRAICISLHPLQLPHFHTFLPPAMYHLLTAHTRLHPPSPDHVPPLQVGTAQWLFALWPTHFFAFLDGLEYWSAHTRKKHAFSSFPDRFLLEFTSHDALSLLSHTYKQYHATIPIHTLHLRIQAHLDAFHLTTPRT